MHNYLRLLIVSLILVVATVFALHLDFLGRGFYEDDFNFFGSARSGFYGAQATDWADFVGFWNPWRGWFYRPVFLTYFAVVQAIVGRNAVVFHALGLILHALVAWLLGLLVARLTRHTFLSILSTIFFLLWPGKEEAIWWISSHSALLAALFSLSSLHCWLSYRRDGHRCWFVVSVCCLWLALCSKSEASSLPCLILLLDIWYDVSQNNNLTAWMNSFPRRVSDFIPILGLFILYLFCEVMASHTYATQGDTFIQKFYTFTLTTRLYVAFCYLDHLCLSLVPVTFPALRTIALAGVIVTLLRRVKDQPLRHLTVLFLLWTLVASLPVPLTAVWHSLASRFFYFSSLWVACAAAVLLTLFVREWVAEAKPQKDSILPPVGAMMQTALSLLLIFEYVGVNAAHIPFPTNVVTVWGIFAFVLLFAYALHRFQLLDYNFLLTLILVCVAAQIQFFLPPNPVWLYVFVLALLVGVLYARAGSDPFSAVLFVLLLWQNPVFSLPSVLIFVVLIRGLFACGIFTRFKMAQISSV